MMDTSFFKAFAAGLAFTFSSGCYYAHVAKGQWDVMNSVVSASSVVMKSNPDISLDYVVSDIKDFAVDVIGLESNGSYSDFYPANREGMTFVVTASEKFSFNQYFWCYPILGCSPHRGFFDEAKALDLEAKLKGEGLDTFVFPSVAYSTLGIFDDPVTPFMLDRGIYGLVEIVVHEMTHQKVFVPNQGDFNEELASFVGGKAAEQFFLSRGVNPERIIASLEFNKKRGRVFSSAMQSAIFRLNEVYNSGESEEYMLAAREVVFGDLKARALEIYPNFPPERLEFNNARLLNEVRYSSDSSRIRGLWEKSGGSWNEFWKFVDIYVNENF
ncbi:MAG: aminopeptidase [archaeon]